LSLAHACALRRNRVDSGYRFSCSVRKPSIFAESARENETGLIAPDFAATLRHCCPNAP
jgi:hypothetical protein